MKVNIFVADKRPCGKTELGVGCRTITKNVITLSLLRTMTEKGHHLLR